jgi:hypothetical protein
MPSTKKKSIDKENPDFESYSWEAFTQTDMLSADVIKKYKEFLRLAAIEEINSMCLEDLEQFYEDYDLAPDNIDRISRK